MDSFLHFFRRIMLTKFTFIKFALLKVLFKTIASSLRNIIKLKTYFASWENFILLYLKDNFVLRF